MGETELEGLQIRLNFSRNVLFRMVLFALVGFGLLAWKMDFILDVYFRKQLTTTGYLINGAIIGLFALGLLKVVFTLLGYMREETALLRFVRNLDDDVPDPVKRVAKGSMIAHRYQAMERLHAKNSPVSHGALAAALVAAESTRASTPKFINNVLILTGVFGTIVALSISLIGASDLLETSVDIGGMGMVVHGMSTALSTTMTAIVCYLYFGYFYLKLTDVQTNLISGVEQVTTTYLVPRFQVESDSILYEFSGLIRSLQALVNQMEQSQNSFEDVQDRLMATLDAFHKGTESINLDLSSIQGLLSEGFRLPKPS